ncbi:MULTISPECIES: hypothetical protein [unclassified Microcoleus]|uniref:hypothetical protein n=1 Tax=unclassified Microcoleus TaxID=2642155 RepID=UPI002FD62922
MRNYQLSAISYQLLAEALVFPHCTMVLTPIHFSVLGCLPCTPPGLADRPIAHFSPMAAIANKSTI